jgi:hypothetical protein
MGASFFFFYTQSTYIRYLFFEGHLHDLLGSGISDINRKRGKSGTCTDTIETETLKTTIRDQDDLSVSEDLISVRKIKVEEIMRTGRSGFDQGGPFSISLRNFLIRGSGLQDELVRVVTTVVRGVNDSLQEVTSITETDEDVISVSRGTRTLGLPTVTHVGTTTGQEDVGTGSVMLVGDFNSASTVTTESEIDNSANDKKCLSISAYQIDNQYKQLTSYPRARQEKRYRKHGNEQYHHQECC